MRSRKEEGQWGLEALKAFHVSGLLVLVCFMQPEDMRKTLLLANGCFGM